MTSNEQTLNELEKLLKVTIADSVKANSCKIKSFGNEDPNNPIPPSLLSALESINFKLEPTVPNDPVDYVELNARGEAARMRMRDCMAVRYSPVLLERNEFPMWWQTSVSPAASAMESMESINFKLDSPVPDDPDDPVDHVELVDHCYEPGIYWMNRFNPLDQRVNTINADRAALQAAPTTKVVSHDDHPILNQLSDELRFAYAMGAIQ